jgi:hypothetical protein
LLFLLSMALAFVRAYVLWCGWHWHALAFGAPEVGYRMFAAVCVSLWLYSTANPKDVGKVSQAQLAHGLFAQYALAGCAFVALWILGGAP